jgi:transcriptional regulator with XRE-family HTH domain
MMKNEKRAAWIYYRLRLKGLLAKDVARAAGVSRRMVTYVINGKQKSHLVRAAVAEALGLAYEKVWGEKEPVSDSSRPKAAGNA